MVLKLINWKLHSSCWKAIGMALAKDTTTVYTFEVKASNLADEKNMLLLFTGSNKKSNENF